MKNIVSLVRVLQLDFKRAIFSRKFALTLFGVVFISLINLMDHIELYPGVTVCYLFNIRGSATGFTMAIMFLVAVPYASSFYIEYRSNHYKAEIIRSNILFYSIGKVVTTVAMAIVAYLLGYILLACLLGFFIPIFPTNEIAFSVACGTQKQIFTGLLVTDFKWLYIVCILLADSLMYGLLAAIALYISTISMNPFVISSSPIITFYAWCAVADTGLLPDILKWHVFDGIFMETKGLGINMILTILYYMFFIALISIAFVKGVKRRIAHG